MKTWNIRFYEHRKIYFAISLLLAAAMLLGLLVRGVSLDIQFKGGALLTYSYQGEVDAKAFTAAAQEVLGKDISLQASTDIATGGQNFVISLPTAE